MKYGTIKCTCAQLFYFESAADSIKCPKCQMIYKTELYLEKLEEPEEPIEEVGEEDETDI